MGKSVSLFLLTMWISLSWSEQTTFNEERFNQLVEKMESTVKEMAREVERLYAKRCDEDTIATCEAANYENCRSQFPNPQCPPGPYFYTPACGNNDNCSSQWDITKSSTRIPGYLANGVNGNPTDPQVIEALCFTRPLDDWFVKKRNEDLPFWQSLGIDIPPSMYYGSNTGAFRIFPARHTDNCGAYDPTTRPWFVAGGSGPKNIIMVLDVSGSIDEVRLSLLKAAAKRVVETLTVQDRITIIPFATSATRIADTDGRMFKATAENIVFLSKKIDELVAGGRTNFYDAFDTAFDVFDATVDEELYVSCNSAILFFTDGERTDGPENDEVTQMIQNRIANIQPRLSNRPILLFTYSISQDELVHEYPSQLACAVERGVWSKISSDDEIVDSLSSYYQLFALGLGSDANADFVGWVEPYEFFSGQLGTTVSVPVYDRTKSPPLFLGVVAVDIPIAAIDAALGVDNADAAHVRAESIRRVVSSSRVTCPLLNLTPCELASFQLASMPDGSASCSLNCTADQLFQVEEEACPARADYPTNFWDNVDFAGLEDANSTCCPIDETMAEWGVCPPNTQSTSTSKVPVIAGSVAGGVSFLCLLACLCCNGKKSMPKSEKLPTPSGIKKAMEPAHEKMEMGTIQVMPPPQNPAFQLAGAPLPLQ